MSTEDTKGAVIVRTADRKLTASNCENRRTQQPKIKKKNMLPNIQFLEEYEQPSGDGGGGSRTELYGGSHLPRERSAGEPSNPGP
jgi:hypothetical protein